MLNYIMRYFFIFFALLFSSQAFACSIEDSIKKSVYAVVRKGEGSRCHNITLNFPGSIPSGDSFVWADPYVSFKVNGIVLNLEMYNSKREGFKSVIFCLPEEIIIKTTIDINYEERSTKNPPHAISFCTKTVTIDNLEQIIKTEE